MLRPLRFASSILLFAIAFLVLANTCEQRHCHPRSLRGPASHVDRSTDEALVAARSLPAQRLARQSAIIWLWNEEPARSWWKRGWNPALRNQLDCGTLRPARAIQYLRAPDCLYLPRFWRHFAQTRPGFVQRKSRGSRSA